MDDDWKIDSAFSRRQTDGRSSHPSFGAVEFNVTLSLRRGVLAGGRLPVIKLALLIWSHLSYLLEAGEKAPSGHWFGRRYHWSVRQTLKPAIIFSEPSSD